MVRTWRVLPASVRTTADGTRPFGMRSMTADSPEYRPVPVIRTRVPTESPARPLPALTSMMATVGRTYGASSGSPVGGGGLLAVLAGGYVTFRLGTGPPAPAGSYSVPDASSLAAFLTLAALASTSAAISAASSA